MKFKKYMLFVLLLAFMFPTIIKAGEACKSYTLDQVNVGTKNVVCIANPSAQSGIESHHRFVANMHSNLRSVLVVNTVIYMGNSTVPVYCVNENKHGVGDKALNDPKTYSVTLRDWNYFVNLVGTFKAEYIKNIILNGYPTKSASELGFTANSLAENNYDAFTATKLAIFTVLNAYGYSLDNGGLTYYKPATINDGGVRGTKIVQKTKDLLVYSKKTPPNALPVAFTEKSVVTEGDYVVKTVSVNPPMGGSLSVSLKDAPSGTLINGTKATSKTFTNSSYYGKPVDVKISVPVSSVSENGMNMTINMNYKYLTYDIFYGDSGNSYQSYLVPKPVSKTSQATYSFKYTPSKPKVRTCNDIKKEFDICSKNNTCKETLEKEYYNCFPKKERTCDDVKADYESCSKDSSCTSGLEKEYNACFPTKTCEDIKAEYEICNKDGKCTKELIEEYNACFKERTCDDVKVDYEACIKNENCTKALVDEYDVCFKKERTCDDVKSEYEVCNKDGNCTKELTDEYNACFKKERTCDDIKSEYVTCSVCSQVKLEYDTCLSSSTCSEELISKYNECNGLYACSDSLTSEYNACFPKERTCGDVIDEYTVCSKNNSCSDSLTSEYSNCVILDDEENPNTMGANIVLISLAILGGLGAILRSVKRRKEILSQLN